MKKLLAYLSLSCIALLTWSSVSYADTEKPSEPSVSVPSEPSIETPGAESANFPNSAFTLPQGRAYFEGSFNFNSRTRSEEPRQYSASYFLRYGVVDDVELRLFSNGYTWIDDDAKTKGLDLQVLDMKWHVMDEKQDSYLPAMAVEGGVQTNWGGGPFKSNYWLPFLSLNFDQTLPFDIALEYNIGFTSQEDANGKVQYQLALAWALQREIYDNVALFVNGYTNTGNGLTTSVIGGGVQWTPHKRLALFTNLSAGLTKTTPNFSALVGFAVAF